MRKIMIVDDEQDFREMTSIMLQKSGYEVIGAESGMKCLEMLENGQIPDLILLDIMMPEMSGWETFEEIKGKHSWKDIPIVFLTVRRDWIAESAGSFLAEDYIEKPFEIMDFKMRIEKVLDKCKREDRARE